MTINNRDERNMVILRMFFDGHLTEANAMSSLVLKQTSLNKRHKYIRSLIAEMKRRDEAKQLAEVEKTLPPAQVQESNEETI